MAPLRAGQYDPAYSSSSQPSRYTYQQPTHSGGSFRATLSNAPSTTGALNTSYNNGTTAYPGAITAENRSAAATLSSFSNQAYNSHGSGYANRNDDQSNNTNWSWSSNQHAPPETASSWSHGTAFTAEDNRSTGNRDMHNSATYAWPNQPSVQASSNHQTTSQPQWLRAQEAALAQAVPPTTRNESHTSYGMPQSRPQPNQSSQYSGLNARDQPNSQAQPSARESQPSTLQPRSASSLSSTSWRENASHHGTTMSDPTPTTIDPAKIHNNYTSALPRSTTAAAASVTTAVPQQRNESSTPVASEQVVSQTKNPSVERAAESQKARPRNATQREPEQDKTRSETTANADAASSTKPTTEEEEMRAMFLKMREYNARNPAMLAKLWEEERANHVSMSTPLAGNTPATDKTSLTQPRAGVPPQTSAKVTPSVSKNGRNNGQTPTKSPRSKQPSKATASTVPSGKTDDRSQAKVSESMQPVLETLSQPASQARIPVDGSQSTTQKRQLLAKAAADWLRSLPQNARFPISIAAIEKILTKNPSYVQLCETLEREGIKFDRPAFARHLLSVTSGADKAPVVKAVEAPSDTAQSQSQQTIKNMGRKRSTIAPVQYEYSNGLRGLVRPTAQAIGHPSLLTAIDDSPGLLTIPLPLSAISTSEAAPSLEEKFPAPANKEEAARKRTFGDLVDLTMEMSSDEEPPPKQLHLDAPLGYSIPPSMPDLPQSRAQVASNGPGALTPFSRPIPSAAPVSVHQHMPKQPTPPAPRLTNPKLERMQRERIKGQMLVEPIMRDRVARKSKYDPLTIARDVLLATGRHPDMRPLNSHLFIMEKLLSVHGGSLSHGNHSDLATIRWNVLDPEPVIAKVQDLPSTATLPSNDFDDADDESDGEPVEIYRPSTTTHIGDSSVVVAVPALPIARHMKRKERRRERIPDNAVVAAPSQSAAATPKGYSSFRQSADPNSGVKKMGRPLGWRKAIHGKNAGQPPPDETLSDRRRPTVVPKAERFREPHYQVFKCKWAECSAELHNLETLKKHVVKIHGVPSSAAREQRWVCRWRGCKSSRDATQAGSSHDHLASFASLAKWTDHVEERHLAPFAWKLGDGPRGGLPDLHDTESESYLSDARGRSVTPVIKPSPEGPRHGAQAGSSKNKNKATKAFEEFQWQKNSIGIILDKTGATLPNKKRRLGFMDDEDFEDVMDDDNEPFDE